MSILEGKLWFQSPAVLRKYPLVEKTSGDNLKEKSGVDPLNIYMSNSDLSPAAPIGGREPPYK